jgi:hypothetical protein
MTVHARVRFRGLIPSNRVVLHEKCSDLRLRRRWVWGGVGLKPHLIKIVFLLFLKLVLCFLETIFTGGFITPTASENRFPLAVLIYLSLKIMISTGP